tara:strand:- start:77 stop:472 length:396 start_codon:yes stop_codon:yes gene_type:complete
MNEKEEVNGLSDIYTDPNRTSESTVPDIAGKISADCENLGQTLRMLADEIEKLHKYQNNLARKIPPSERVTDRLTEAVGSVILANKDLRDAMWPLFEEKVKKLIRSAEVDIDATVEINDASLEIDSASLRV